MQAGHKQRQVLKQDPFYLFPCNAKVAHATGLHLLDQLPSTAKVAGFDAHVEDAVERDGIGRHLEKSQRPAPVSLQKRTTRGALAKSVWTQSIVFDPGGTVGLPGMQWPYSGHAALHLALDALSGLCPSASIYFHLFPSMSIYFLLAALPTGTGVSPRRVALGAVLTVLGVLIGRLWEKPDRIEEASSTRRLLCSSLRSLCPCRLRSLLPIFAASPGRSPLPRSLKGLSNWAYPDPLFPWISESPAV